MGGGYEGKQTVSVCEGSDDFEDIMRECWSEVGPGGIHAMTGCKL